MKKNLKPMFAVTAVIVIHVATAVATAKLVDEIFNKIESK